MKYRIRKTSTQMPLKAQVLNQRSESEKDTYSADYINNMMSNSNITFYGNSSDTISITPTSNCYIKIEYMSSTWGYDGQEFDVMITNTVGSATSIYNLKAHAYSGNTIARSLIAKALFRCDKNVTYTFVGSGGSYASTNSKWITAEVIPIN